MDISIHALREEGDSRPSQTCCLCSISIHALREEGDVGLKLSECLIWISIHALREEGDSGTTSCPAHTADFYPRPPRGGRPGSLKTRTGFRNISIHALREEGDPKRGAHYAKRRIISIHALREEGD